jgi:hypothetical protein
MKYIFLTNIVSPHQLPWCREFVKLVGTTNFLYLAVEKMHSQRKELGWGNHAENWIQILEENPEQENLRQQLETCDVLFCSLREFELFQQRSKRGLKSFYLFERWFKPPVGMLRMLHPGYLRMCYRAAKTFSMEQVHLMPIGIFAAQDMARMQAILHGKLQNLFYGHLATKNFVRKPMAAIDQEVKFHVCSNVPCGDILWNQGKGSHEGPSESKLLRILWCGQDVRLEAG